MSLEEARPTRESPADGNVDVLMLGNSYTAQNSLSSRVQALFDETGTSASVSDLTGGGMKLYQHADNAESNGNQWHTTLTNNQFDYVILQDQSQVPSFPTTETMWQNSKNGAIRLDSMIEAAGAETIFFMTWGYRDGDSNNAWLNPDYPTMQANLEAGYNMYAENITTANRAPYIAPVGLAYKAIYDGIVAGGGTPTDQGTLFYNLYSNDGSHPSTRGSYLAACVIHSTMTGESSIGLTDPFGLSENDRQQIQQAADSVVFDESLGYSYPWQNEPSSEPEGNTSEASNLWFGSSDGTNVLIEPGGGSGFTVNITNNASFTDIADIYIQSNTGWDMSWNYGDGNPANGYTLQMDSDSLHWIQFAISVPEVSMGLPLAESRHSFTVIATSQHDGNSTSWTFTVEVLPWNGAEIAAQPVNATVDPDLKVRVPVTVRNLGNEERSLAVRIRPVSQEGATIPGQERSLSFTQNGWSVGIFELYNTVDLQPYSEGTVQVEFDAPYNPSGTIWVEFSTWSSGASQQISTVQFEVNIIRERQASIQQLDSNCENMDAGSLCTSNIKVTNDGNYLDTFEIETQSSESLTVQLQQTLIELRPYESATIGVTYVVEPNLEAGTLMTADLKLVTEDGSQMGAVQKIIEVNAKYDWEIDADFVSTDDESNVTVAYTLRNIGNIEDGLDVTVSTNIYTDFALIPPATSIWESEEGTPNHFTLNDVPIDSTVTFRAWMQLPRDQEINGTATLTIEIRSTLEPDILFTNQTEYEYLAEKWRTDDAEEVSYWDELSVDVKIFWNNWGQILISLIVTFIGAILLHKAVVHRQKRDAEWAEIIAARQPKEPEKVEDWMEKFTETNMPVNIPQSSVEMDAASFKQAFQKRSNPKPQKVSPSEEIIEAAHTVFEHHDEKADYAAIDDLAGGLLATHEPHDANKNLQPSEVPTSRTVRKPKREFSEKEERGDDDLDLDL